LKATGGTYYRHLMILALPAASTFAVPLPIVW
jgi:hypothetical protein